MSLVPTEIITDIARVREYGVNKYGKINSWKEVEKDRYKDAAYRHLLSYLENEDSTDEESGLPHLWHLACNIAFLCHFNKKINTTECETWTQTPERVPTPPIPSELTTTTDVTKIDTVMTEEFDWEEMKKLMKEKSEQKIDIPELDCKITDSDLFKEFIEFKNTKARQEANNARS